MKTLLIVLVILVLGGGFYWFQIRPAEIRKKCVEMYPSAFGNTTNGFKLGDALNTIADAGGYEKCLRENGLEK